MVTGGWKSSKLNHYRVRSFDNTRAETIQFHTPLTLIVGYNGSGKTVRLSCNLKEKDLGDQCRLLSNVSNTPQLGSCPQIVRAVHSYTIQMQVTFVRCVWCSLTEHQICNEKEVLAQVKLSFQTTSGDQMVITRNLQLTVKKTGRQQKTLEGSLTTKSRNGERISVSSRVAELDKIMPHHLGVSKAVLDFVIFCHQDESLWPMSEPAPLKKKFDEIFEALKYTKAIDNIKLLRKGKGEDLKRLKDTEQFSKVIKNKGDKAEKESRELDAQLKELTAEISDHRAKANEADKKFRDASDRAAEFTTIIGSLKNEQSKLDMLQDNLNRLDINLRKRDEPDEWLQSELDHYEERMAAHRRLEEQQIEQYQDLERRNKDAEAKLSRRHVEAGKREEQRANHERYIEERKALVTRTSRQHNIRGYDTDLDDMQIGEYMDKIGRLLKDQNAAVEKVRRKTQKEMDMAQTVLNKLAERKSALRENKTTSKSQINANNNALRAKQSDVNKIETDEGGRAILEANIKDLEVRLQKAKDDSRQGHWDNKIKENETQLKKLIEENEELNEELYQGTKQAGELASLDHLKKDAADCERNINKMKEVYSDRFRAVVGHTWEPSRLENQFQTVIDQRSRNLKDAERDRDIVLRKVEQTEYKLTTTKADFNNAEKELKACVQILNDNVDGEPEKYDKSLSDLQEARDVYKADFDNFENQRRYFTKGIAVAHGKHHCNLCERPFRGRELTDFVKRMEEKLIKETAEKVALDLKETEEELRKAKEAGPSHDAWVRLSQTEIPRLREDVKRLGDEREKMLHELETQDKNVKEREEAKMDVESLEKPVANTAKYHNDLARKIEEIKKLSEKQKDSGMPRTVDETRKSIQSLQVKIRDLRNTIEKLKTDRERARSLSSALELDLSKANNSLSTATHELEKRQSLAKQIDELKNANQDHQARMDRLDMDLQEIEPQYADEETKKEEIQRRGMDKERDLHQEAKRLSESVQQLQLAAKNIAAYTENGGSAQLDKCRRDVKSVEQEISNIKDEQRQVTISINKIKQEVNNQDSTKRNIQDNIAYRQNLKSLDSVKAEISELSARNNEADRENWLKQKNYWQRIYNDHYTEQTSKLGNARAKDDQLATLLRDWETEYKDAAENFKKAHIEVEVRNESRSTKGQG